MIINILCFLGIHFYVHRISDKLTDEWICNNCKIKEKQ